MIRITGEVGTFVNQDGVPYNIQEIELELSQNIQYPTQVLTKPRLFAIANGERIGKIEPKAFNGVKSSYVLSSYDNNGELIEDTLILGSLMHSYIKKSLDDHSTNKNLNWNVTIEL